MRQVHALSYGRATAPLSMHTEEDRDQRTDQKSSPLDRSFFRGINLRQLLVRAVEEPFHVVHQKPLGIRIYQVEAIVIDDACLGLQPLCPARLANLCGNFLT